MDKIICVPDSFKGTLSSEQICEIIKSEGKKIFPNCEFVTIPVADGGEGSVDCFIKALNGVKKTCNVSDAFFEKIEANYCIINNNTAVIEMASCCGLPLVEHKKNPMLTTTYGVGEIIIDAIKNNCTKIIMALGGSSTNDGGCGAAAALGVKFFDKNKTEFVPTGGTLINIQTIDVSNINTSLKNIEITTMCDIDNPLYGEFGAAYVFAPQKGADDEIVKLLDEGLINFSNKIKSFLNVDVSNIKGAGAAGGMGAGMVAFFGSSLEMGIETVLDAVKFDDLISNANLIITGEGKIDNQSLSGKVVVGVAKRAKAKNVPVLAIVGTIGDGYEQAYNVGVTSVFSINRTAEDFSVTKTKSEYNLRKTIVDIFKLLKAFKN